MASLFCIYSSKRFFPLMKCNLLCPMFIHIVLSRQTVRLVVIGSSIDHDRAKSLKWQRWFICKFFGIRSEQCIFFGWYLRNEDLTCYNGQFFFIPAMRSRVLSMSQNMWHFTRDKILKGTVKHILLLCTLKFQIEVNNDHTYRFLHRLHPVGRFQTLVIEGDVRVKHVQFRWISCK